MDLIVFKITWTGNGFTEYSFHKTIELAKAYRTQRLTYKSFEASEPELITVGRRLYDACQKDRLVCFDSEDKEYKGLINE